MLVLLPTREFEWYGPYPVCQGAEFNGSDICEAPARYDVPTRMGPWAHLCTECASVWGSLGAKNLGTHLVQVVSDDTL